MAVSTLLSISALLNPVRWLYVEEQEGRELGFWHARYIQSCEWMPGETRSDHDGAFLGQRRPWLAGPIDFIVDAG